MSQMVIRKEMNFMKWPLEMSPWEKLLPHEASDGDIDEPSIPPPQPTSSSKVQEPT